MVVVCCGGCLWRCVFGAISRLVHCVLSIRPCSSLQVLLDNPLSAVDQHTAIHIFSKCIRGMLKDKAVLWITHQLELLPQCDKIAVRGQLPQLVAMAGCYLPHCRWAMPRALRIRERFFLPVTSVVAWQRFCLDCLLTSLGWQSYFAAQHQAFNCLACLFARLWRTV
jgi:hypothetical protein